MSTNVGNSQYNSLSFSKRTYSGLEIRVDANAVAASSNLSVLEQSHFPEI